MSYVLIRFSNPPKQRKSVKFFAIVFAETRTRDSLKIPEKWGFSAPGTCLRRQMPGGRLKLLSAAISSRRWRVACSRFSQVPQGLVAVTLEVPFEPVLLRPLPALGRHPRLFRMPATRPRSGFLRAGRGQGPLIWGRGQVIITTMAFEPRGGPSGALSPVPMPAARGLKPGHVAATWPPRVGGCG